MLLCLFSCLSYLLSDKSPAYNWTRRLSPLCCAEWSNWPLICRQLWQYIWLAKRIELKKKILIYLWNFQANSIRQAIILWKRLLHCRLINLKFTHRLYISIQLALTIHCISQSLRDLTEKTRVHCIISRFSFISISFIMSYNRPENSNTSNVPAGEILMTE